MITYNQESYIKQAIEGVLMQVCDFGVELIISDDNSNDTTKEIVSDIIKDHPNGHWIKYVKHSNNLGMIKNFLFSLNGAKGKYIALCEGDDYWTNPSKLQEQVDFMDINNDCSMCYHSVRHRYMTNNMVDRIVGPKSSVNIKYTSEEFIKNKYARTVSLLIRSSVFQKVPKWPLDSPIGDYPLQMLCALQGNIGYIGGEPMAVYRVGVSGSTNNGRFGTKEEQKRWMRKRLYNNKKSRDLFNENSDYKYHQIIKEQKQKFSFGMLDQGLTNFNRFEMLKLYKEYIPYPIKLERKYFRFWFRFLIGPKLFDSFKKKFNTTSANFKE
ncbi:glycosyltransferase [Aequorivita capsosiphonis]|uniref:glycosyltransferase n=1 Tax=Aequorivita capsosiphonis TaxID=487317 RepID=UPI001FE025EC|nr:glycosyltransferase [Aequorivita capsosiphonis]